MHPCTSFPRYIHVFSPANTGLQFLYTAVSHYCGDEMHSGAAIEGPYGTFERLLLPCGVVIAHCDHFTHTRIISLWELRFLHPPGCWWKRQCNQLWVAEQILIKYSRFLTNQRPEKQLIYVISSARLFLSPRFCPNYEVYCWVSNLSKFTELNDEPLILKRKYL